MSKPLSPLYAFLMASIFLVTAGWAFLLGAGIAWLAGL